MKLWSGLIIHLTSILLKEEQFLCFMYIYSGEGWGARDRPRGAVLVIARIS